MTASSKSCVVAFPRECNCATPGPICATTTATPTQPPTLKALAEAVFMRNQRRNCNATRGENTRNFSPETDPQKLHTEKASCTEPTTEKVAWLKPCPICSGHLFIESDRGGYFCCECQTLPKGAKPARIVEGRPAVKSAVKITKLPRRQVNCQAYEQTGFLMSTSQEHCREYHGPYCSGCPVFTIH